MERIVKERLVGAAVLMAAAIILIPEMLSGPDRESHAEQPTQTRSSDAAIKTYTIDLSQSPSVQPTPGVIENRAPPPETAVVAEPPDQVRGPQPAAGDQAKPEATQPSPQQSLPQQSTAQAAREEPPAPVVEPLTTRATPPVTATATPRPLASGTEAPTLGRWAVQVGSFSKQATAERLAKQLRDQGQSAFVMPVKSGGATLYRVRIGPLQDRASAEAVLRDVKSSAPGAAIVAHP